MNKIVPLIKGQIKSLYQTKINSSENTFKEQLQKVSPVFTEEVIELLYNCFKEIDKNSHEKRLRILETDLACRYNFNNDEILEMFEWKKE